MRNNSGDDEKRNNLHDPTLREKQDAPDSARANPRQRTTGMGSGTRKSGQEGEHD